MTGRFVVQATDTTAPWLAFIGALIVAAVAAGTAQWRQRVSLNAEQTRLASQLAAERDRLALQIAAEVRRTRHESERTILDDGATLLALWRTAVSGIVASRDGGLAMPAAWDEVVGRLPGFLYRLKLWFPADDEVLQAFGATVTLNEAVTTITRRREASEPEMSGDELTAFLATLVRDVEERAERFLDTARTHLNIEEEPPAAPTA